MQIIRMSHFQQIEKPLLHCYQQLWFHLKLVDGIVYCGHSPEPLSDLIDVPIVPSSLQKDFLLQHLKSAAAGHQGSAKRLQRLCLAGYWVNMAGTYVDNHCRECLEYQQSKLPPPVKFLWLTCHLAIHDKNM